MSVPSQPSSPEGKHQTTGLDTDFAAMTIAATTAMPIATTQAELTFQSSASSVGLAFVHYLTEGFINSVSCDSIILLTANVASPYMSLYLL